MDEFVCALYDRPGKRQVDELSCFKLNDVCTNDQQLIPLRNIDMTTVPPCRKSLELYVRRVDYQVEIWKSSHLRNAMIPAATDGNGWTYGKLESLLVRGCSSAHATGEGFPETR